MTDTASMTGLIWALLYFLAAIVAWPLTLCLGLSIEMEVMGIVISLAAHGVFAYYLLFYTEMERNEK